MMRWKLSFWPSRLTRRFAICLIVFSSTIACAITGVDLFGHFRHEMDQVERQMEQVKTAYLPSVVENVWVGDTQRLRTLLMGITSHPDIVYAAIRVNGVTETSHGQGLSKRGVVKVFDLHREYRGRVLSIGELEVHATYQNAIDQSLADLTELALANALKTILVAVFIFYLFDQLVGRHLRAIARFALSESVRQGRNRPLVLDRHEPRRPDELSRLVTAVTRMRSHLLAVADRDHLRAQELERELIERRRMESRLNIMATVFESSRDAIMITDAGNRIIAVNEAFSSLTGYSADEVLGSNPRLLSAGLTPLELYKDMWRCLSENGSWQGEIWDRRKDGKIYPKWLSINAVRDTSARVFNYVAIFSDITQRKEAEEKIYHLAHHDSLTGLANRMSLTLDLTKALLQARNKQQGLAVMFIDLDRFKEINDVHGHGVGDRLLKEVAQRLKGSVRHGDTVARLGGDEFVIVLPQIASRDTLGQVAEKIRASVERPYLIEDLTLRTASSVGLAIYPQDGETAEALMKSADLAMYAVKSSGRNNIQFYSPDMEQALLGRVQMVGELRTALDEGQLVLHYQPQFCAASGRMVGVEALLRWAHPDKGWVAPGEFIPVAEQSGLILPIGEWVLNEACRQWRAWFDESGHAQWRVAVNLSAQQLEADNLYAMVASVLERYGVPPACLELEITESMLMENIDANVEKLVAIRSMGVKLAIDDFGTGYSSLNYLRLLPIHSLKLDRSFVQGVESDRSNAAICMSVIALAHNLGLEVVAEGVELPTQRDFLRQNGCDTFQGFLFGRPVPAAQIWPQAR